MLLVAYRLNKWLETTCVSLETVGNCVGKCQVVFCTREVKIVACGLQFGQLTEGYKPDSWAIL